MMVTMMGVPLWSAINITWEYLPMVAHTEPIIVAALQAFDVARTIRPMSELLNLGVDALPFALFRNLAKLPNCFG